MNKLQKKKHYILVQQKIENIVKKIVYFLCPLDNLDKLNEFHIQNQRSLET